jgi:hypothetical protein
VPRRRGHEDVEAPTAVVPVLERRDLDMRYVESRRRATSAISTPSSTAVTEQPSSARERVA